MLNFNTKIYVQKHELAFRDECPTNFFFTSMPATYEGLTDNFNMHNILTLEKTVHTLCIKETKFTNLGTIKEKSVYFAALKKFCGRQG